MPQIYVALGQDGAELCHPVDSPAFDSITDIVNGTLKCNSWVPVEMKLIREDESGRKLHRTSSPWLGNHALIFRPEVLARVGNFLMENGELLPVEAQGDELYLFNALLADILDESNSVVRRFEDGRIKLIESYRFKIEALQGLHLFKIPNLRASPTFLSGEFVDGWCQAELRGLDFELVWDSSEPPIVRTLADRLTGKGIKVRRGPG